MDVDHIVIGAGAAGSVVAGRLSADPRRTVLLIEAGGRDTNPLHRLPKGFYLTLRGERYAVHYPTAPVGPGGQAESWTRGRVLGGSTTVNGMMWLRGAPADFDGLAALGNPGWGWADASAAYAGIEAVHGVGTTAGRDEVTAAILAAGADLGWDVVADVNASDTDRIGFTPTSVRHGVRSTAYRAFVHPVRDRRNLTVLTRTTAGRLLFDGDRVVGVRARHRGVVTDYRARRGIVLSAGAVETPLLLERSGIGRPDVLARARIDVRLESPHVGERIVEQRAASLQVRTVDRPVSPQRLAAWPGRVAEAVRYAATRRGPLATGGYDLTFQYRSSPALDRPDVQGVVVPMALDTTSTGLRLARHAGILVTGYALRPTTRSSVHVSGPDPADRPVIEPRFLADAAERAATGTILATARRLLAGAPLAGHVIDEEFPGPGVTTPEETVRYALDTGSGIFHAVGSAAMGPEDDDVVDATLRVRGVDGLRVADASVFPAQLSGNSAAPTMVAGWIAADRILAEE